MLRLNLDRHLDRVFDSLIDWLVFLFISCLLDWLIGQLIDCLIDWFHDWLIGPLINGLISMLICSKFQMTWENYILQWHLFFLIIISVFLQDPVIHQSRDRLRVRPDQAGVGTSRKSNSTLQTRNLRKLSSSLLIFISLFFLHRCFAKSAHPHSIRKTTRPSKSFIPARTERKFPCSSRIAKWVGKVFQATLSVVRVLHFLLHSTTNNCSSYFNHDILMLCLFMGIKEANQSINQSINSFMYFKMKIVFSPFGFYKKMN